MAALEGVVGGVPVWGNLIFRPDVDEVKVRHGEEELPSIPVRSLFVEVGRDPLPQVDHEVVAVAQPDAETRRLKSRLSKTKSACADSNALSSEARVGIGYIAIHHGSRSRPHISRRTSARSWSVTETPSHKPPRGTGL